MSAGRRWDRAYRIVIAGVALQRLLELLLSRRNERRSGPMLGTAGSHSYVAMVVLHTALFGLPLVERRLRPRPAQAVVVVPALCATAAATLLRLWVIKSLGNGWNVRGRVPAHLQVIDSGPYRFVRHPNYVAVALEMAALPLAAPAPIAAALLSIGNAAVLAPRIRAEEALLSAVPGYLERMGSKPRFLPRLAVSHRFRAG